MSNQLHSLLDDSLNLFKGKQLKKALTTAQIALDFGNQASADVAGLAFAHLLLACIYNTNAKYQIEPSFYPKATYYLEKARSLNQLRPSVETTANILIADGKIHLNKGQFEQSKQCFDAVLDYSQKHGLLDSIVNAYACLGQHSLAMNDAASTLAWAMELESLIKGQYGAAHAQHRAELCHLYSQAYILLQEYSKSLEHSQELLQLSRQLGDAEKEVVALRNIAVVCGVKSNYKIGMQYFLEALDKCEAIGYREMVVQVQINIGTLYAHLFNYEEAIRRYENVLTDHSEFLDVKTKTVVFNNLGNIYLTSDQPETAIGYFETAYQVAKDNDLLDLMAYSLAQLSRTKIALNQFEPATVDASIAQQIFDESGLVNGKQINLLNLGRLAFEENRNDAAALLAQQAIELAQHIKDDTAEIKGYKLLSKIYKKKGQYQEALECLERYSKIQEEAAKVQKSRHTLDMEIRHATREKQKEIELLTKENEYQSQLLQKSEQITRQNEELVRVNDDLRQFAYIASHDLKEPLRMIGSFTQVIEKLAKPHLSEKNHDYFRYVNEGVNRMNKLLDGLLRYSTVNQSQEVLADVALNDAFNLSMANLKIRILETNAVVERGELPLVKGTQQLFVQLFQNLLSNAIKFVKPGTVPYIKVTSELTPDAHIIHVADNGIGVSEENQAKIFEVFKRLHHQSEYEGTGIGLAICQKIAKRLGGSLTVESKLGLGATFSLILPKSNHDK